MKNRKALSMCVALSIVAALVVWLPDKPASATTSEIGNQPTIRSIAIGSGLEPNTQLLVRTFLNDRGLIESHVTPFDRTHSFTHDIGSTHMYDVNDFVQNSPPSFGVYWIGTSAFFVDKFQVSRDPSGPLQISGPIRNGPFGGVAVHGRPHSLAVVGPIGNSQIPEESAIGTDLGYIILGKSGIVPCAIPAGGPVVSITVVPQVGHFAFLALVNRRDGQHLIGVRPLSTGTCAGTPGLVEFDLTAGVPIEEDITVLTSEPMRCDPLCQPLLSAEAVNVLGTNGTRFIHRLTIPAEPTIGGTFGVRSLKAADSPIKQAAVGPSSLALLPVDGAGVLFDPGFRIDRGGISGKLLTIVGSSLEVSPRRLSLQGRRRSVSIFIEVANSNAALIDRTSLNVTIGGTSMANDMINAQLEPDDNDHDGNLDLEVKLNREAVQSLIPTGATAVTIAASWRFNDGSVGRASAEIRIKSQGDDDDEDSD